MLPYHVAMHYTAERVVVVRTSAAVTRHTLLRQELLRKADNLIH
jgi:hypothetical protein